MGSMRYEPHSIFVFADWSALGSPRLIGTLHVGYVRGKEVPWFEYSDAWLKSGLALEFDPELKPLRNKIYPAQGFFGAFADASPDRWGRKLMLRREARQSKSEGRAAKLLTQVDFLLGVDDFARMGALRFKNDLDGPFLDAGDQGACPPLTELRALQHASLMIDSDDERKVDAALKLLLRPGGSLGGARPKANVIDPSGALWIAKFPSDADDHDIGGWEELTAQLARGAGIDVSRSRAEKLGGHRHHTFLTVRFDREGPRRRLLYASAMTLLMKRDGESEDCSYLDLLEVLAQKGASPKRDFPELWRRIVFSVCVSNSDDHLRNHGFLYDHVHGGWALAPAFDLNPNPHATGLTLAIDEHDNALSLDLAMTVAPYFQMTAATAKETMEHIKKSVRGWRTIAKRLHLKPSECELMAEAFERDIK